MRWRIPRSWRCTAGWSAICAARPASSIGWWVRWPSKAHPPTWAAARRPMWWPPGCGYPRGRRAGASPRPAVRAAPGTDRRAACADAAHHRRRSTARADQGRACAGGRAVVPRAARQCGLSAREAAEADLARIAVGLGPAQLRQAVDRLMALINPDDQRPCDLKAPSAARCWRRGNWASTTGRRSPSSCPGVAFMSAPRRPHPSA